LEEESRRVIQFCERYAEGLASLDQVTVAANGIIHWDAEVAQREETWNGYAADVTVAFAFAEAAMMFVSEAWGFWNGPECGRGIEYPGKAKAIAPQAAAKAARDAAIADLIRCVLGNPLRAVAFDPAWLVWNDGAVHKITQEISARGDFALLPILADALEEAGCRNEDVLAHCRLEKRHVCGCWVLDLLLKQE
jgi:hypothetical protein